MKINNSIFEGYENTNLVKYDEIDNSFKNTYYYDDLENHEVHGFLKSSFYKDGRLMQTYSESDCHVAVIAGTGLGKTTSYGIPNIVSIAHQKEKRNMIITDPKGEYYRIASMELKKCGYKVMLLNFRNYRHSECWNPLRYIYDLYMKHINIKDKVELVKTKEGYRNRFMGKVYEDQTELDEVIYEMEQVTLKDVENEVDELSETVCTVANRREPYWELMAQKLFKAFIWGMLEDIDNPKAMFKIDEHHFNYATLIRIIESVGEEHDYFTDRDHIKSHAFRYAQAPLIVNGNVTARCVLSTLASQIAVYNNSSIANITIDNSFFFDIFTSHEPIAFFIDYADESAKDNRVISDFIKQVYKYLIGYANEKKDGKLTHQVVFILDEFGNLPEIPNFANVISACRARNIYFNLILQSYAQLDNIYGKEVSKIIRDNLNVHIFMGTNDYDTLQAFSVECGEFTRVAPVSALRGNSNELTDSTIETIKRMPKSVLAQLKEGDCIVTEGTTGYVMYSRLERYFRCPEFTKMEENDIKEYKSKINPYDRKYLFCKNVEVDDDDDDDDFFKDIF